MRRYREDNPQYSEDQKKRDRAKHRAMTRLRKKHESEFHQLFTEELQNDRAAKR